MGTVETIEVEATVEAEEEVREAAEGADVAEVETDDQAGHR